MNAGSRLGAERAAQAAVLHAAERGTEVYVGREIALKFTSDGASVVVSDLDAEPASR